MNQATTTLTRAVTRRAIDTIENILGKVDAKTEIKALEFFTQDRRTLLSPEVREQFLVRLEETWLDSAPKKLRNARATLTLAFCVENISPLAPYAATRRLAQGAVAKLRVNYADKIPEIKSRGFMSHGAIHSSVYNMYKRSISFTPDPLSDDQQLTLLKDIVAISSSSKIQIRSQETGATITPDSIGSIDQSHNLLIANIDSSRDTSKTEKNARLTLTPKPCDVLAVTKYVVTLLTGEYREIISNMKVLSPSRQGQRCDSIVVYLNQADPNEATQLAQEIAHKFGDSFNDSTPLGMERIYPGISYGEVPGKKEKSSFGNNICDVATDAVISNIQGKNLDLALNRALRRYNRSPTDPSRMRVKGNPVEKAIQPPTDSTAASETTIEANDGTSDILQTGSGSFKYTDSYGVEYTWDPSKALDPNNYF